MKNVKKILIIFLFVVVDITILGVLVALVDGVKSGDVKNQGQLQQETTEIATNLIPTETTF